MGGFFAVVAVMSGIWWATVGVIERDKVSKAMKEVFKPCVTDCENKPYAIPEYKIGKQ